MSKFYILLSIFIFSAALAEEKKFPPLEWSQEMVNMIADVARDKNLQDGTYPDGVKVGKESLVERKVELLTPSEKMKVVNHSVFWNSVNWCGLSMKKADFSWMQDFKKWNKKQMVYIAILHGTATSFVTEQFKSLGKCSKEFKNYIQKKYSKTI